MEPNPGIEDSGQDVHPDAEVKPLSGNRTPGQKTYTDLGADLARFHEMYGYATWAINQLYEQDSTGLDLSQQDLDRAKESKETLDFLVKHSPEFCRKSSLSSEDELLTIAGLINIGRTEARNTDTKRMKSFVKDSFGVTVADNHMFLPFNPPLTQDDKSDRGYNHNGTGRLLTPVHKSWDNIKDVEDMNTPGFAVPPTVWYRFMYPDLEVNLEDVEDGLLRSEYCLKAFLFLFKKRRNARGGRQRANVPFEGHRAVTPASIAYMATLLRFALDASPRIDRGWNFCSFYGNLVDFLRDEGSKEFTEQLISFYVKALDPSDAEKAEDDEAEVAARNTWLAVIKQRGAKVAAAQRARKEAASGTVTPDLIPQPSTLPTRTAASDNHRQNQASSVDFSAGSKPSSPLSSPTTISSPTPSSPSPAGISLGSSPIDALMTLATTAASAMSTPLPGPPGAPASATTSNSKENSPVVPVAPASGGKQASGKAPATGERTLRKRTQPMNNSTNKKRPRKW